MTKLEMISRFNCYGTIGNETELIANIPERPWFSYHLMNLTTGTEVAIRYDLESIEKAYETYWMKKFDGKPISEVPREFFEIVGKPILTINE